MLELLKGFPPGIGAGKAAERMSKEDFEQVIGPIPDEGRGAGRRLCFSHPSGPKFEDFTPGAAGLDAKVGIHSPGLFDRCAILSDVACIWEVSPLVGFLIPCPVRMFGVEEHEEAAEWPGSRTGA